MTRCHNHIHRVNNTQTHHPLKLSMSKHPNSEDYKHFKLIKIHLSMQELDNNNNNNKIIATSRNHRHLCRESTTEEVLLSLIFWIKEVQDSIALAS